MVQNVANEPDITEKSWSAKLKNVAKRWLLDEASDYEISYLWMEMKQIPLGFVIASSLTAVAITSLEMSAVRCLGHLTDLLGTAATSAYSGPGTPTSDTKATTQLKSHAPVCGALHVAEMFGFRPKDLAQTLMLVVFGFLVAKLLRAGCHILSSYWDRCAKLERKVLSTASYFAAMLTQDLPFHDEKGSAILSQHLRTDPGQLDGFVLSVPERLLQGFIAIFSIAYMVYSDWKYFMLAFMLHLPVMLGLVEAAHRTSLRYWDRGWRIESQATAAATESLSNIRLVQSCTAEEAEAKQFIRHLLDFRAVQLSGAFWVSIVASVDDLYHTTKDVALLIFGCYRVYQGEMTLGAMNAFQEYMASALRKLATVQRLHTSLKAACKTSRDYLQIKNRIPAIPIPMRSMSELIKEVAIEREIDPTPDLLTFNEPKQNKDNTESKRPPTSQATPKALPVAASSSNESPVANVHRAKNDGKVAIATDSTAASSATRGNPAASTITSPDSTVPVTSSSLFSSASTVASTTASSSNSDSDDSSANNNEQAPLLHVPDSSNSSVLRRRKKPTSLSSTNSAAAADGDNAASTFETSSTNESISSTPAKSAISAAAAVSPRELPLTASLSIAALAPTRRLLPASIYELRMRFKAFKTAINPLAFAALTRLRLASMASPSALLQSPNTVKKLSALSASSRLNVPPFHAPNGLTVTFLNVSFQYPTQRAADSTNSMNSPSIADTTAPPTAAASVIDSPANSTSTAPNPNQLSSSSSSSSSTSTAAPVPTVAALHNISFTVQPGKVVAIVGPSGSGKTTIARLLLRFYDCAEGSITLNGQDIKDMSGTDVRRAIGLVDQDTSLLNRSVEDNLLFGSSNWSIPRRPPPEPDQITGRRGRGGRLRRDMSPTRPEVPPYKASKDVESDMVIAARAAQALQFIEELPSGFATVVGERGARLSGGQRQRLTIARALLRRTPVVILDEATSSLDAESESLVSESLRQLTRHAAVIMITHRLAFARHADEILVLQRGNVIERGTHEDLLTAHPSGQYARMVQLQSLGDAGLTTMLPTTGHSDTPLAPSDVNGATCATCATGANVASLSNIGDSVSNSKSSVEATVSAVVQ